MLRNLDLQDLGGSSCRLRLAICKVIHNFGETLATHSQGAFISLQYLLLGMTRKFTKEQLHVENSSRGPSKKRELAKRPLASFQGFDLTILPYSCMGLRLSRHSSCKDPDEASVNACFQVVVFKQLPIHVPATVPALRYDSQSIHIQNVHKVKHAGPHT